MVLALFNCNSGGYAVKIKRVVFVQRVVEVPGSRIKNLDRISLIVMVKTIHEISFVAVTNKSATRGEQLVFEIPTICVYNLVPNLI